MARRAAVAAVLLLAGSLACSPEEAPPPPQPTAADPSLPDLLPPGSATGQSLLLVTLDTTRADRLGAYGYAGAETPNLDRLAARGLRFTDAVSPVPMTLPAHASLMTGLDPPGHGLRVNGEAALVPERTTLAEALREEGYDTAAFVSSFVLDPRFGLDQGFAVYDARLEATRAAAFGPQTERSAGAVTDAAVDWLRSRGGGEAGGAVPFFLWVHYFDPHDPYEPPEPFASRFRDRPYDGEIAYMDREVGRLLAALEREGLENDTVVVAAGDHGESLGEHGERYHSRSLYEGAVRVPWILAAPHLAAEARGRALGGFLVSLPDLFPTLLDLLGAPEPDGPEPLNGRSLLRGPVPADRIVYLETLNPYLDNGWAPLYAARRHREKYVRAPRPEYYDLAADPGETTNLLAGGGEGSTAEDASRVRPRAKPLRAFLEARLDGQPELTELAAREESADPDVRRRLEALGYLSGGPAADLTPDGPPDDLPDPKDMLPLLEELTEGRRLLAAGEPEAAARKARLLVRRSPRDRAALQLLGEAYATMGRLEEAERSLRRHLEVGPAVGASVLLAQVVMQQGRLDEAEALLDQAEELDPRHGAVPLARGDLALVQGRPREAIELYERAREVDPYRFEGLAGARIARVEELMGDEGGR